MKVPRNSMISRSLFQNKCSEIDGMESPGRRTLRHIPSTNVRYTSTLDKFGITSNEQDMHELVKTMSGMVDMKRQDNRGVDELGLKFL